MICACDHCHYLFASPELPEQCPDCGKRQTRPADETEQREYLARQQDKDLE